MVDDLMSDEEKTGASVPAKVRGVTVPASPFNVLKLELAIIFLLALICWILVDKLVSSQVFQLAWLGGFGMVCMSWLIFRIRQLKRRLEMTEKSEHGKR